MKACRQWEQLIVEYVDGVLQEPHRRSLEDHLATCMGCAEAVETQRWTKQAVAQLERGHAPAHLSRRIQHHARASWGRQRTMRLLSRVSVAAALAAAMLLAFWWSNLRPNVTSLVPADEPTIAQAIVQEYLGAMHNDGFSDPSLQLLARETQLQILRLEPTTP